MFDSSYKNFRVYFFLVYLIIFLFSPFSTVFASQRTVQFFNTSRSLVTAKSIFTPSTFVWRNVSLSTHTFTHTLPQKIASQVPSHFLFTTPVLGYMPTKMGGYVSHNDVGDLFREDPLSFLNSPLSKKIYCSLIAKISSLTMYDCGVSSETFVIKKTPEIKDIELLYTQPRSVTVVGLPLSDIGEKLFIQHVPHVLTKETFSDTTIQEYTKEFALNVPRISHISLLPIARYSKFAFGGDLTQAATTLRTSNRSLPLFDQLSLSVFCSLASLSTSVDTSRCNYETLVNSEQLAVETEKVTTTNTSTTTSSSLSSTTPSPRTPSFATVSSSPVYINNYITKYIEGTPGKDGSNGRDGKDGISPSPLSIQGSFGGFVSPITTSPTPQSLIGVSTIGYLKGTTIEYATYSYGTSTNMYLANANVNSSVFNGYNTFNDTAVFTGNTTINNLTATTSTLVNTTLTNSTSTNAYIGTLTASSSVLTDVTITNSTTTLAAFTQSSSTNAFITNLVNTNASTTNATTTNSFTVNASTTNSTTTNAFIVNASTTNATSTNSYISYLTSLLSTITNLIATNATTTNLFATSSNIINATSTISYTSATGTVAGNFQANANVTLGTSTNSTVVFNALVASNFIPVTNNTYDLGSNANYFRNGYLNTLNVNNLSAASTSISGTASNDITINSDNTTPDTEDMSIIFFRGVATPNALFRWSSTNKRFEFNQGASFKDETLVSGSTTLSIQAGQGQGTKDLFQILANNGTVLSAITSQGYLGIGSSTPNYPLTVTGNTYLGGNLTATGTLTVSGQSTLADASSTNISVSGVLYAPVVTGVTSLSVTNATSTLFAAGRSSTTNAFISNASTTALSAVGAFFSSFFATNASTSNASSSNLSSGGASITNLFSTNASTTNLSAGGATFGNIYTTGTLGVVGQTTLGNASTTGLNTTSQTLLATASGNVGIGNTTPNAQLAVGTDLGVIAGPSGVIAAGRASGGVMILGKDSTHWSIIQHDGTNDLLSLGTRNGGQQVLNINASGNVGIGTTTPVEKLEVNGGIKSSGQVSTVTTGTYLDWSAATTGRLLAFGTTTAIRGGIQLYQAGSNNTGANIGVEILPNMNVLLAQSNGNVGIGTTIPLELLHLSSATPILKITDTDASNAAYFYGQTDITGLSVNRNPTTGVHSDVNKASAIINLNSASADSYISFYTNNVNNALGTEKVRIDKLGNVGIGTSTPVEKLVVNGNAQILAGNNLYFQNVAGSGNTVIANTGAGTNKELRVDTGITGAFFIQNGGNVGIGTTTPSTLLTVGSGSGSPALTISGGSSANTGPYMQFTRGATAIGFAGSYDAITSGSTNDYSIYSNTNLRLNSPNGYTAIYGAANAEMVRITNSGDVGIGTTTPGAKLDTEGVIRYGLTGTAKGALSYGTNIITLEGATGGASSNTSIALIPQGTGNVGVNTLSPGLKLSVVGADQTTQQILYRSSDVNWNGRLGQIVNGGTIGSILSSGGSWTVSGATFSATKDYDGSFPTAALYVGSQYNSSFQTSFRFLRKAAGVTTTDGTVTELMTIDNSGNVGIGITNPANTLDVRSSTVANNQGTILALNTSTSGSQYGIISRVEGASTKNVAGYFNASGATNNYGLIVDSGYVGIGETAPAQPLSIYNASASINNFLNLTNNTNGFDTNILLYGKNDAGTLKGSQLGFDPDLYGVYVGNSKSDLFVAGAGNVGIGTTTPLGKLDVSGDMYLSGTNRYINIYGDTNTSVGGMKVYTPIYGADTGFDIDANGGNGQRLVFTTAFSFKGSTSTKATAMTLPAMMFIDGNTGYVGIGTSTPTQRLTVSGTIQQISAKSCGLSSNAAGDIICTSDERLKDVSGFYNGGLAQLQAINPIRFNYKNEIYNHVGFSAQNIASVLPEGAPLQENGFYGLDSNAVIALSVNAIKELNINVNTLANSFVEYFTPDEAVDVGTVVTLSDVSTSSIRKASNTSEAIGIVTTSNASSTAGIPIAFSGKVLVQVSDTNGVVKKGDYLTVSSTISGKAVRQITEGQSLGIALTNDDGSGRITMLLNTGYQKVDASSRAASTTGMLTTGNIDLNANGVALTNIKSLTSANGSWSIGEDGHIRGTILTVDKVETKTLCVNDLCVTDSQFLQLLQNVNVSGMTQGTSTSSVATGTTTEVAVSTTTDSLGITDTSTSTSDTTSATVISSSDIPLEPPTDTLSDASTGTDTSSSTLTP